MKYIEKLFPVHPLETQTLSRFFRQLLVYLIIIIPLATLALLVIHYETATLAINGLFFIAILGCFFILKQAHYVPAAFIFLIVSWLYIILALLYFGGLNNAVVGTQLVFIIVAGTLLKRRGLLVFGTLSILTSGFIMYLALAQHLPHPLAETTTQQAFVVHISNLLASGTILYFWLTQIDRHQKIIQNNEHKLASILNALPDVLLIIDADGMIHAAYTGQPQLLRAPRQDVIGHTYQEFLPPEISALGQRTIQKCLASGAPQRVEYQLEIQGGKRWFQAEVHTYQDDGKTYLIWDARDITETRQAQTNLQKLYAELEARVEERTAQLQASLNEMEAITYTISHDLRAPLRGIHGYTRILENDFSETLPPPARQLLKKIIHNAFLMGEMVDDLLFYSKLGRIAMRPRPVDMASCLQHTLDLVQMPEDAHIEIGSLPQCFCDLNLIRQVWTNLLENAVKFRHPDRPLHIQINAQIQADDIIYAIRDNGQGFEMQYAEKIFGIFERLTPNQTEGTGIGLAICQRIIKQHGGRIWAEASPEEGATFYFSLPKQRVV